MSRVSQYGALNQKIWQELEKHVREQAKAKGTVYVITGPLFYSEAEEDAETATGYIPYTKIGKDQVAVPTHFFKIVLWQDQNKWQGVGFVVKNQKDAFPKPYDFNKYVRSIQWIEERTGLDFEPELAGPDAVRLEQSAGHMWN